MLEGVRRLCTPYLARVLRTKSRLAAPAGAWQAEFIGIKETLTYQQLDFHHDGHHGAYLGT